MNDLKRIVIVVLGLVILTLFSFGVKGHIDSNGYKNQVNYTTAVQAKDKEHFNYAVDSEQGRVLASGNFTTKDAKPAKFDEMNKGYTYVNRVKEHYTMHTRTVCTSTGKTQSCHTEVYYTWDEVSSEESRASHIKFMEREYPTTLFSLGKYNKQTNCAEFSSKGTGTGFFQTKRGCIDGEWYIDDNDRYVYYTVPTTFNASFLATTYGGLKPFNENAITLENKSIETILKDVGKYQLIGFWVLMTIMFFLIIGACVAAYSWVMADGKWSMDE